MNTVGLWRITTATVTSTGGTAATASNGVITIGSGNTSLVISNVFSADFYAYRMIIRAIGSQAATADVTMKHTGSGSNFTNSIIFNSNTAGPSRTFVASAAAATIGNVGNTGGSIILDTTGPQTIQNTIWSSHWSGWGTSANFHGVSNGILIDSTQYTSFTLALTGGSFSSGFIYFYGYND
jgi:hypothetical protein